MSHTVIRRHAGDCDQKLSEKYLEYIQKNRDVLQAKCNRINNCIDNLLMKENYILLMKGENLSLNKTCSLLYERSSESSILSGQCTSEDRADISEDLNQHVSTQLADVQASGWRGLKKCLDNGYGDSERTTYVNDICGLARKQTLLCENRNIHQNVTAFFSNQINTLQCTCRNIQKGPSSPSSEPKASIIGGIVGAGLGLALLILVIFLCYRRRNSKKKKKQAPNCIYLPAPNADNCPVYQEVCDENAYQAYGRFTTGSPPTLPMRYHKPAGFEEEPAYLEPVEAGFRLRSQVPIPGRDNPNYGAPPRYSDMEFEKPNGSTTNRVTNSMHVMSASPEESNTTLSLETDNGGYESTTIILSNLSTEVTDSNPQVPVPVPRSKGSSLKEVTMTLPEQELISRARDSSV